MDLIDDPTPGQNTPELTVSELSNAVKRVVEQGFGHVRVRAELGRVTIARSGHVYLDLKDDRAVISGVIWRGVASGLRIKPEEGMEVVATGRLTTFPGQSKYQLVVESLSPAGVGALMVMLEKRKAALAAEGLFDVARKKPLPTLPRVIGVVTSPTGAVIRDILHRLRDRFPREVLVWPVLVQGDKSAAQVAAAIEGFNALPPGGAIPRPDVLIVARGGGSIEDLWGFNEETVVRAAAASEIPLISAVGHETDTTLIDYASDRRAPTPTAAAEMAVPVRADLMGRLAELEERRVSAMARRLHDQRRHIESLGRALPRPEALIALQNQRFDSLAMRLPSSLMRMVQTKRVTFARRVEARMSPGLLKGDLTRRHERLGFLAQRLAGAGTRLAQPERVRLANLQKQLESLSYKSTLRRGYAVVRDGEGRVLADKKSAEGAPELHIEFRDGEMAHKPPRAAKKPPPKKPSQGSLF